MNKLLTFLLIFSLLTSSLILATNFVMISDLGASARSIALGNVSGYSQSSSAVFSINLFPPKIRPLLFTATIPPPTLA